MLLTDESPQKCSIRVPDSGPDILPMRRLIGVQPTLSLPTDIVVHGLQDRNIGTIGPSSLELAIDTAIMVFGYIDGKVQSDVGKSGFPGINGGFALAHS